MKSMRWALGLLCCAVSTYAVSQESRQPWDEYDKRIKSAQEIAAFGPDLFGDSVNLLNGALSFSVTDVNVPGNNKLPVALTRSLTVSNRKGYPYNDSPMADWDLDIPRISGVFGSGGAFGTACTATTTAQARPPYITVSGGSFPAEEYWHGYHADLPGGGEMLLVNPNAPKPSTGGPYYWMTAGFTYFACLPSIQNAPGQGFLAVTADGTKYWLDWMATYHEPSIDQVVSEASSGLGWTATATLYRSRRVLYATRIEDRFGNWVTYTYANSVGAPVALSRIDASDGRYLILGHNGQGHVETVTNGEQTWTYQYDYSIPEKGTLTAVILPDASRWTLNLGALTSTRIRYDRGRGEPGEQFFVRSCESPGLIITSGASGTITHPSGAVGEFSVEPVRHGRSNVPMVCGGYSEPFNNTNDDIAYYTLNYDALSLAKKRVTGAGLPAAEWNYFYASDQFFAQGTGPVCYSGSCMEPICMSDDCAGTAVTTVAGPEDQWIRYTYGNSYRYNEGKLLKVERGTGLSTILKTETTAYELAQSGQTFQTPIGFSPKGRGEGFAAEYLRPQRSAIIAQDGATFSRTVAAGPTGFDAFARPTTVTKSSSLGCNPCSRTDTTVYSDNLDKWVLGQVASVTNNDTGKVESRTTFDPVTALPLSTYSFGNPQPSQTMTYYGDGTVATVKDGNSNTTTLSDWKRGIPQFVQYPPTPESPSGATERAEVNDVGWVRWFTDEVNATHNYEYDPMGRLGKIVYPSGDSTTWYDTIRSFVPVNFSEYGIAAGHWRLTVQTGTGVTTTYYDALWQPLLVWTRDTASVGTDSFVVNRYDGLGRKVFTSYPVSSLSTVDDALAGTVTSYDGLDRVYQVNQDSELGAPVTTTTEYLPGFQVRVTNPRLYPTTTSFQAFDVPSTDAPISIALPGGVSTTIVRDVFGKPLSTTRTGPGG